MASLYAFFLKKKHVDHLGDVDISVHYISPVECKGSYNLYIIAILSPMMSLYIILTKSGITIFVIRTVFIPSMVSGSMFSFAFIFEATSMLIRMTIPDILESS